MSDSDERETKPFKFVTGKSQSLAAAPAAEMTWFANLAQLVFIPSNSPRVQSIDCWHIGFDARFPNQNQTKHCWQNYVDYNKCITAKGEDFAPCRQVHTPTIIEK